MRSFLSLLSLAAATLLSACSVVPMKTRTTPDGKTIVEKPSLRIYSSEDGAEDVRFKLKRRGIFIFYKREF